MEYNIDKVEYLLYDETSLLIGNEWLDLRFVLNGRRLKMVSQQHYTNVSTQPVASCNDHA